MNIVKNMEAIFLTAAILGLSVVAATTDDHTNVVVSSNTVTLASQSTTNAQG